MSSAGSMVEETILEKRANYMVRSFCSRGGHLILTNRRLVFKPHLFNIRSRDISVELGDIVDTGKIDAMAEIIDAVERQIMNP